MINPQLFYQWWDIFHATDEVVEIRLIGDGGTFSGYFTNCNVALDSILTFTEQNGERINVYSPFNHINPACANRQQLNKFLKVKKDATSDVDIDERRWLMIDFDPKRPTGTNASDAEKDKAKLMMSKVAVFLRDNGFRSPVVAMSGNGYHLYYKIHVPNSEGGKALISNVLKALDMLFSDDGCEIDTSIFNAARITKVIGCTSHKGRNTPDRPCRMSTFIRVPDDIEITPVEFLKKIENTLPQKEAPNKFNGYRDTFDIDKFIQEHNIEHTVRPLKDGGRKLILKQCPFNDQHKAPDAAIFVGSNGAIGFRCLHNSCSHYTWKDVRLHFDPSAYSQKDRAEYQMRRNLYSTEQKPAPIVLEETDERGKKWQSLRDIEWQDPSKMTYIPTGVHEIDKKMGGLCLGDVTIISGLAGAGKTSIINQILLTTIQYGFKAAVWSGELAPSRFKSWINQTAAGPNFVKRGTGETEYFYCPKDIAEKIDRWTEGKLFLYNNNYGNKSSQIIDDMKKCVKENGTQLCVIDNKMAMSLDSYDGDKNERDAGLINELKDFAMLTQIHVILVCHPRKEQMNSLLRMESIAGNSDLYNAAANVFLAHRVGRDFEKRAKEFFGKEYVDGIIFNNYNEVIEVAKNRSHGVKDFIAGLYFESKTRRFLNSIEEYVVYGWQDEDMQQLRSRSNDDFDMPEDAFNGIM